MLKPFPRSASGESAYRGAEQQEEAEGTERVRKPGTWRNTTHSPIPSPRPPSSASERSQELSQKQGFCCDSSGLKEMPRTRMPRGRHSCTVHKSSKSGGASGLSGSSPTSEPVMVMDGLTPGQRALGAAGRDRCARARIAREVTRSYLEWVLSFSIRGRAVLPINLTAIIEPPYGMPPEVRITQFMSQWLVI